MLQQILIMIYKLNKTESAVFIYCRFSLFLNDPVFLSRLFIILMCFSSFIPPLATKTLTVFVIVFGTPFPLFFYKFMTNKAFHPLRLILVAQ